MTLTNLTTDDTRPSTPPTTHHQPSQSRSPLLASLSSKVATFLSLTFTVFSYATKPLTHPLRPTKLPSIPANSICILPTPATISQPYTTYKTYRRRNRAGYAAVSKSLGIWRQVQSVLFTRAEVGRGRVESIFGTPRVGPHLYNITLRHPVWIPLPGLMVREKRLPEASPPCLITTHRMAHRVPLRQL